MGPNSPPGKGTEWLTGVLQVTESETIRVLSRGPEEGHCEVCSMSHDKGRRVSGQTSVSAGGRVGWLTERCKGTECGWESRPTDGGVAHFNDRKSNRCLFTNTTHAKAHAAHGPPLARGTQSGTASDSPHLQWQQPRYPLPLMGDQPSSHSQPVSPFQLQCFSVCSVSQSVSEFHSFKVSQFYSFTQS